MSRIRFRRCRPGAAALELAVCMPILFLVTFGAIEATSMTFLRQTLVQTAYESVKESVQATGTKNSGIARGGQVLAIRGVQGHSILFSPDDVDGAPRGTPITVTVSAPGDLNTVFPFGMFSNQNVVAQATMLKEH